MKAGYLLCIAVFGVLARPAPAVGQEHWPVGVEATLGASYGLPAGA